MLHKDLMEYPEQIPENDLPIALDTETLGVTRKSNLLCYYSWAAPDFGSGAAPVTEQGFRFLRALCASERPKVFHNAKFDFGVLERVGLSVKGPIHDTILQHSLIDPYHLEAHRLKALSRELLSRPRLDAYAFERARTQFGPLTLVPQELVHPYSVADAEDTLTLFGMFSKILNESGLWSLYLEEVETELAYRDIEARGILVNLQYLDESLASIVQTVDLLRARMFEAWKGEFNPNSHQQVAQLLLRGGLALKEKTEKGHFKTGHEILVRFVYDPRVKLLLAYTFLNKAATILSGYKERLDSSNRLHPDFRQSTATGRSACSDPNLQNIPHQRGRISEVEVGDAELARKCAEAYRAVRRVFVAPLGAQLLSADYSQIEYKFFAHYSGSERLISQLKQGVDFHRMVCELVFGQYDERLRHIIKILNYGLLYGMGRALLAARLLDAFGTVIGGPTVSGTLTRYAQAVPEMRRTQKEIERVGHLRGYVIDVFGRRYPYKREYGYILVSYLCQGSAANVKKRALTRVNKYLKEEQTRSGVSLDIHDELVFEWYPEDEKHLKQVSHLMTDFPQIDIPLTIDIARGDNFMDMEEAKHE